ncbi:hypothetical protein ROZALSC1DRAFT_30241 [Rozella allomycis CSF55]|uniref:Uncharacterized protein n=1 Tax=Rozella allomycis (strain CSF55) TaxID=988480 RepID=A0A075AP09_ROZAC|nr:hypothetical protein O9G_000201 [Rozella allomycis CSF55]RKP18015.1 hypothetical protein ROZALSC1DRAFT_30241 [Rozella allomycis CSF55]|eukprot:EPZ31722.1 hypothetical protein O9G_000201 [Rozella allomycis CSF55]
MDFEFRSDLSTSPILDDPNIEHDFFDELKAEPESYLNCLPSKMDEIVVNISEAHRPILIPPVELDASSEIDLNLENFVKRQVIEVEEELSLKDLNEKGSTDEASVIQMPSPIPSENATSYLFNNHRPITANSDHNIQKTLNDLKERVERMEFEKKQSDIEIKHLEWEKLDLQKKLEEENIKRETEMKNRKQIQSEFSQTLPTAMNSSNPFLSSEKIDIPKRIENNSIVFDILNDGNKEKDKTIKELTERLSNAENEIKRLENLIKSMQRDQIHFETSEKETPLFSVPSSKGETLELLEKEIQKEKEHQQQLLNKVEKLSQNYKLSNPVNKAKHTKVVSVNKMAWIDPKEAKKTKIGPPKKSNSTIKSFESFKDKIDKSYPVPLASRAQSTTSLNKVPFLVGKNPGKSHSIVAQAQQSLGQKKQKSEISLTSHKLCPPSQTLRQIEDDLLLLNKTYQKTLLRYQNLSRSSKPDPLAFDHLEEQLKDLLESMDAKGKQLLTISSLVKKNKKENIFKQMLKANDPQ